MPLKYASFRKWHRWLGLASLVFLLSSSATGLGLLWKKQFPVLQPPTQRGIGADVAAFISIERAVAAALAPGHADIRSVENIDRIDVRPDKGVFKVRSARYSEIQIDATTGAVLSESSRVSDLLEDIHDGSLFSALFHRLVMPVYALTLLVLVLTGLVTWYLPWKMRRKRSR